MNPKQILKQRGIDTQADLAGWQETDNYWQYPVFAPDGAIIAYRLKKYPFADVKAKYLWKTEKPTDSNAEWYVLPETDKAIKDAGGVAYISNGEPALLAYHAAGVHNVLTTTLSEIAFPKDGVVYLKALNITRLLYPVDNDKAGQKAAVNWRDALRGSGIDFEAFAWGDIPEKADANDVWMNLNFDGQAFQDTLKNLAPLELPAPSEPLPVKAHNIDYSGAYAEIKKAIYDSLSATGHFTGKKFRSGFYQMTCIHHDDHDASAGYHPETGVINCFVCGTHKLNANTLALGIDIQSYFPKQEGKKKPKKADFSQFHAALDELGKAQENLVEISHEQYINDDIMGRVMAYEAGQFVSFVKTNHLPLSLLSASMTLSTGSSSFALFIGRLHTAIKDGLLPSVFTRDMLIKALKLNPRTISKCLIEANHLGFTYELRTLNSINNILPQAFAPNLANGGKPPMLYALELSFEDIQSRLNGMLEIFYLEKHARKAMVLPTGTLAGQMGLDDTECKQWYDLAKIALQEDWNKQAKRDFDKELFGDGVNWHGWQKALSSDYGFNLDYFSFEDSRDLRGAILLEWITKVRPQNSRDELMRLLGCSDPIIDATMDSMNIISIKQNEKVEIEAPSTVKGMQFEFNRIQRELRGKCWKISFFVDNEWLASDDRSYLKTYATWAGKAKKVFMIVTVPSYQRPMTEDEILERDEKRAQEQAEKENLVFVGDTPKVASSDKPKTEPNLVASSEEKAAPSVLKWDRHSYKFQYNQVRLAVHKFTPHKLVGHVVLDSENQKLQGGNLADIMRWLLDNADKQAIRETAAFYGKEYDENQDIALLQTLADERLKELNLDRDLNRLEQELNELPYFEELPKQKPLAPVKVETKPVILSDENPYMRDKINYPKSDPKLFAHMGTPAWAKRGKAEHINHFANFGKG